MVIPPKKRPLAEGPQSTIGMPRSLRIGLAVLGCLAMNASGAVGEDDPPPEKAPVVRPYVPPNWAVTFSHQRSGKGGSAGRGGTVDSNGTAKLKEYRDTNGVDRETSYERQLTEKE